VFNREEELEGIQPNYLSEISIPYFGLIVQWYGVYWDRDERRSNLQHGSRLSRIYRNGVDDESRTLIHLDERLHSPFYEGSICKLKSGMAI